MTVHFSTEKTQADRISELDMRPAAYRDVFKRFFDIAFVLATAIVTVPVIIVLAILVALDGHSPLFFQKRVGKNNKTFSMVKLRTMVPNADAHLATYLEQNEDARREWEVKQKLTNDPRITRIGRILRKTSLDELTQFWNVLIGDMSVVGPRPMMPSQRALYPGNAYFAMRPGVTGPWQVSDRNEVSFASRARFDAEYLGDLTLVRDISLVLQTLRVVARGTGC